MMQTWVQLDTGRRFAVNGTLEEGDEELVEAGDALRDAVTGGVLVFSLDGGGTAIIPAARIEGILVLPRPLEEEFVRG